MTGIVAFWWQLITRGVGELEWLAVGTDEGVSERVEGEVTSEGKSGHDVRRSNEGVCGRVSIITASKVAVVGSDNLEEGKL